MARDQGGPGMSLPTDIASIVETGQHGKAQAKRHSDATHANAEQPAPPLKWLDMSTWDIDPVPERQWAIHDRVPLRQAGLFSGEGGGGKSLIEMHKDVTHVAGKDWLGSLPEKGPAFYIGAEDDADEIQIRLAAIAKHCQVKCKQLVSDGGTAEV
jgi:RecA-family ATPase